MKRGGGYGLAILDASHKMTLCDVAAVMSKLPLLAPSHPNGGVHFYVSSWG